MSEPTPRQQAGYLRRLLRRGALQVIDPDSGVPLPASVEVDGDVVRLLPALGTGRIAGEGIEPAWAHVLERLRKALTLVEAEELAAAVEAERAGADQPARSYIPHNT